MYKAAYRKKKAAAFKRDLIKLMTEHKIGSLRVFVSHDGIDNTPTCMAFDVDGLGISIFNRIENQPKMRHHNKLNTDYKVYCD